MLRATNIQWDTDGEDVTLPKEIDIPENMTDEDEISDYLSDTTGFCHMEFDLIELHPYYVSLAVETRANIKVYAVNPEDAKGKAENAFMDFECGDLEIIDVSPVNCEDEHGNLTDYNG